jgi:hypothetical protein
MMSDKSSQKQYRFKKPLVIALALFSVFIAKSAWQDMEMAKKPFPYAHFIPSDEIGSFPAVEPAEHFLYAKYPKGSKLDVLEKDLLLSGLTKQQDLAEMPKDRYARYKGAYCCFEYYYVYWGDLKRSEFSVVVNTDENKNIQKITVDFSRFAVAWWP